MATGTVSSVTGDVYQTVATVTTTSGTTATFSSLAGYKKFLLTWQGVGLAAATQLNLRFNGDSTSNNYVGNLIGSGSDNSRVNFIPLGMATATNGYTGYAYIDNVLDARPKEITGITSENNGGNPTVLNGMYFSTSAITSMVILTTSTYTAGTWTLYGIAA